MADLVAEDLAARGWTVFPVCAASHEGLRELMFAMAEIVAARRAAKPSRRDRRASCSGPPSAAAATSSRSSETGEGWRVRGEKPERWIRQTDFSNDEAVGFLADRLNRLGVEEKLVELGAVEGDAVLIGDPRQRRRLRLRARRSMPAPRCSAAAARTSASTRPSGSQRRRAIDEAMPTAARARPAPTWPGVCDDARALDRRRPDAADDDDRGRSDRGDRAPCGRRSPPGASWSRWVRRR